MRRAHRRRLIRQHAQREPSGASRARSASAAHALRRSSTMPVVFAIVSAVGAYSVASERKPSSLKIWKQRLARGAAVAERVGSNSHRHVGADPRELAALPRVVDVGQQRFAVALVLDLGGVRDQVLERAVGGDQLARALLADAGHALDVVDRVAHQREHVDDLVRRDAELLLHARGVVPGALVARVEDADAVADELKEVLVAGDDRRRRSRRRPPSPPASRSHRRLRSVRR